MLMVHNNEAIVEGGQFLVDRKFHDGLSFMVTQMGERITTVNPRWTKRLPIMDMVRIPMEQLPYNVLLVDFAGNGELTSQSRSALEQEIARARLVIGQSFGSGEIARRLNVPYVALVEYDLATQLVVGTAQLTNPFHKWARSLRIMLDYFTRQVHDLKGAAAVHCNGYPIYHASRPLSDNRLLYLDSRLLSSSVIAPSQLETRLLLSATRPLRLLYSGRFAPMKGVIDVVKAVIECQRNGVDVELSLFGQGDDRGKIEALIGEAPRPHKIQVHEPVEFAVLMNIAKEHDAFVCCHVQSDPSCSYVESMGAGLPIVGYDNRMWMELQRQSEAGLVVRMHDIGALVEAIALLAQDHDLLAVLSRKARKFAAAHCFEAETNKRIVSMREVLSPITRNSLHRAGYSEGDNSAC